jgi:hypothetical protein
LVADKKFRRKCANKVVSVESAVILVAKWNQEWNEKTENGVVISPEIDD